MQPIVSDQDSTDRLWVGVANGLPGSLLVACTISQSSRGSEEIDTIRTRLLQ